MGTDVAKVSIVQFGSDARLLETKISSFRVVTEPSSGQISTSSL